MTTILEKRRAKVERLAALAITDRKPHKYIQARFILKEISTRLNGIELSRETFLNQIRK